MDSTHDAVPLVPSLDAHRPGIPPAHGDSDAGRGRRLLIVDESPESREVLRTVLESRGIEILEATEAKRGLELLIEYHPDVVVLDLDCDPAGMDAVQEQYEKHRETDGSLVLLGRVSVQDRRDRGFAKPYHYGPLVRTIEQLFERETPARPKS